MSIKGYCGDTVCITTGEALPRENLQKLPDEMTDEELKEKLKQMVMRMSKEQCAEFLEIIKKTEHMTDDEAMAEAMRLRAERLRREASV